MGVYWNDRVLLRRRIVDPPEPAIEIPGLLWRNQQEIDRGSSASP